MRVAVANQKGGVGKTTTAVNLAAALAIRGRRVLLVDLDPQGNATTGVGINHRALSSSVYDVLLGGASATAVIQHTEYEFLDVLPASIDLAGAELELVAAFARETRLQVSLQGLDETYEIVLIDCPPSLGLLTVNGLTAADWVLVPIQCEYYALEGLSQLLRNVELVRAGLNHDLEVGAIALTMYDARTKLSEQIAEEVRAHFGARVFRTVIPRSVRLSEAPSYGRPAVVLDPSSRGSLAYTWLADEFESAFLEARSSTDERAASAANPAASASDPQDPDDRTGSAPGPETVEPSVSSPPTPVAEEAFSVQTQPEPSGAAQPAAPYTPQTGADGGANTERGSPPPYVTDSDVSSQEETS